MVTSSARDGDEAVVKAQRRAAKVVEVVAGAKAAEDAMSDVSASTAAAGRVMVIELLLKKGSMLMAGCFRLSMEGRSSSTCQFSVC